MATTAVKNASATPRKTRRPRINPSEARKIMADYEHNGLSKDQIMSKYDIAMQTFYRVTAPCRERMRRQNADVNFVPPVTQPVEAQAMTSMTIADTFLNMGDMKQDTRRYLEGMAVVFSKTEEEIVDDLVKIALEIGAVEVHAQKAE